MTPKKHVLLVEDDDVILSLLKELLESQNFEVDSAQNGEEALEILRSKPLHPGVILLDLMMPVMDGFEFMQVQSNDATLKDIPVIAMSADNQIKEKIRGTTASGYFKKPVKIDNVLQIVEKYCL